MVRVEVEVPTREDAFAVRRFAQMRRRAKDTPPPIPVDVSPAPASLTGDGAVAALAGLDAERRVIALLFGQALAQTTDPDLLARGRRVALNFADAVVQRRRDLSFRGNDGAQ